jgi:hypothetical protein
MRLEGAFCIVLYLQRIGIQPSIKSTDSRFPSKCRGTAGPHSPGIIFARDSLHHKGFADIHAPTTVCALIASTLHNDTGVGGKLTNDLYDFIFHIT